MLYVIIALILLLILIIGYGTWMRKKVYSQIDRYESWKIDITNRPVTEEIARVKELKMVGETEKKFETWRSDWDEIVTSELPAVEEKLFDAEEAADKYRFRKAGHILSQLETNLNSAEERIAQMLNDLHEVVDSEHQNRTDIVEIKEVYHQTKKDMITKQSQFKNTVPYLEKTIHDIELGFKEYENETENGNYIKAREVLIYIKNQLESIRDKMETIPKLYKDLHNKLPDQLKELREGYYEMSGQGYVLRHLQVEEQVDEMEKQLIVLDEAMEHSEFGEAAESVAMMHQQVDWLYEHMEKEVGARRQLLETAPAIEQDLAIVRKKVTELDDETKIVQQSYRIESEDLKVQYDIGRAFEKLERDFSEVDDVFREKTEAFSIVLEKLEDMRHDINALRDSADEFKERMTTLRKDELMAKETLQKLRQKLQDSRRIVQKSNLPGIPYSYATILEEAQDLLSEVNNKLEQKPLEMSSVLQVLDDADEKVGNVCEKTNGLVDDAELAEQLIQYGNRYRSGNPEINDELKRAEEYFRSYNFSEAVEIAAAAVQKVEPDIFKKIELYAAE
ncbi:septation ring formation regulator [Scopulibacillus darangshiensis]|uniref:Septation ring formation regulator EzrA n=1 Tax=Scopulibacillus darangshiensis TaxID=442528 RepID=A0A4R2PAF3_9BACL|nr:septation ring formation regulator EzrA [Scopulibacillus darangshiensis]TCP32049.1 septation ring formation regulator [Scopulibacillus darangshiensis]